MKWYIFIATIVAGIAVIGISGCYGPAPGQQAAVTITVSGDNVKMPYVPSGLTLVFAGSAITPISDTSNPVIRTKWSTTPDIGTFLGHSDLALTTNWVAPVVTEITKVKVNLTVTTLKGGSTSGWTIFYIVPSMPKFVFDSSLPSTVISGSELVIAGTQEYTSTTGDTITSQHWTATSDPAGDDPGSFKDENAVNPTWTAPVLPTGVPSRKVELDVVLTTKAGISSVSKYVITVLPAAQ